MQLDDLWNEKAKLIAQAAKKDRDRMDELNKLLATVSSFLVPRTTYLMAHHLASSTYFTRKGRASQSNCHGVLSI